MFEENRLVLKDLAKNGVDLSIIRTIDFSCVFSNQSAAESFARAVEKDGFSTVISVIENKDDQWDVTATMAMMPTCEEITAAESRLASFARFNGGSSDGWGFLEAER